MGKTNITTKDKIDTKEKRGEPKPLSLPEELKILAKIAKDGGYL